MSQITTASDASQPTELSFEDGYQRLQEIAARLNVDEVPVSEMCDLFAEGKGLEIALTGFLDTQRERVEAIEQGEGIRAFRISRTPEPPSAAVKPPVVGPTPAGPDDDIPF